MTSLTDDIALIASRARSWDERVTAFARHGGGPGPPDVLDAWEQSVAPSDAEAFERRLAWDGLTREEACRILAPREVRPEGPFPAWAGFLEEAALACAGVRDELVNGGTPPELRDVPPERLPRFAELWIPFLRAAERRLGAGGDAVSAGFSPAARRGLETWLLDQLAVQAEATVYGLFDLFRQEQQGEGRPRAGRALYGVFVAALLAEGLRPLFLEFSVLGRLLSTLALDWVDSSAELAARLAADAVALQETFGASGPVTELEPGLSDRHGGGRCVARLSFASGARVVYKPRTMSAERAWNGLLGWMESRGAPVPPPLRLLARDGYGWAEYLAPVSLPSPRAAELYFRNAGGLLCAAWIFGTRDLHTENVVAGGRGPVVVDGELAFQPVLAGGGAPEAATAMARLSRRLGESFAATGLLSLEQPFPDGRREEAGGLSGGGGYLASAPARIFRHTNTDAMTLEELPVEIPPGRNLPSFEGRRLKASDCPDAVRAGFEETYRLLLGRREEIRADGGPLESCRGAETRLVFRSSDQYARLLHLLSSPRYLREGPLRSVAIDALNRPLLRSPSRPAVWPLVADERALLERLDVPYLSAGAAETRLRSSRGEVVDGLISISGLEAVRLRLGTLGEENLASQLEILDTLLSPVQRWEATVEEAGTTALPAAGLDLPDEELLRRAGEIGERLLAGAVAGDDGSITWLTPDVVKGRGRGEHGSPYDLYHGAAGIALFLAALGRAPGRPEFADAARAVLCPVAKIPASPEAALRLAEEGLGAATGLGSLLWALTELSGLLPDGSDIDLAVRLASLLTPERIAADRQLDLSDGAAGAAIGLLALHERTSGPEHLGTAVLCGEHLVASAADPGTGGRAWRSGEGLFQAGFAHGASGIALALGRLFAATGRAEFGETAKAAIRFVRARFDPTGRNWPALARDGDGERPVHMTAWCHGAPGIALAHLQLAEIPGLEEAREVADAAIEATAAAGVLSSDHVCCGNAGLIETLLVFGRSRRREDLVASARRRMAALLARAGSEGFRLRSGGSSSRVLSPGFFRGEAGIGYTLLRLASPAAFPSVAAFRRAEADLPAEGGTTPPLPGTRSASRPDEGRPSGLRIEELAAPVAPAFLEMTFPAYRHLLDLRKARRHLDVASLPFVTPRALGAFRGAEPAGLLLAEIPDPPGDAVEVLSLFVTPPARGEGLGTRLLEAAAERFRNEGFARLTGVYMTGQPLQEALERVLVKAGWEPPRTRMLTIRFTLEEARRTAWYGRYPLGEGLTVFPWADLSAGERAALVRSQEERHWIKPDLEPWRHDRDGFEPVSSLGVRYRGELVGWVINHALSGKVVRFTCSFIRRDLGRRGKLVPVFSESIRRLSATAFEECTLTVPLQHEGMARFLVRWCRPVASFFGETRGSQKRLRPAGRTEAADSVDAP